MAAELCPEPEDLACWEPFTDHDAQLEHECDEDKYHRGNHRCYCGEEW